MRKVSSALSEAEKACHDLVQAISAVKEKKVLVEVTKVELFVEESRQLQALLEEAVIEQDEEQVSAQAKRVKEARPKRKRNGKGDEVKASNGAGRPERKKRASKKARDGAVSERNEEPRKKRQRAAAEEEEGDVEDKEEGDKEDEEDEKEEGEQLAIVPPVKKPKVSLKSGGIGRGLGGELVFYMGQRCQDC